MYPYITWMTARSLKNLEEEEGDIRALEGELEGFYRLRVLRYRIIFSYHVRSENRIITCADAAPRDLVYEVFAQRVRELLP
jgi:mRNA interferase RelE/StbE